MLDADPPPAGGAPIAEIERRIRWRALSILAFLVILVSLAVLAVMPILSPPEMLSGLPDQPEARQAADLLRDRFRIETTGLRFPSALLGENQEGLPFRPGDSTLLARSAALLERARDRSPGDPRIAAARACLDLVRGDLVRAERRYRVALDHGAHYGEGRIGLGVTLAMSAATASDEATRRRRLLQAIAQFASVEERDPAYEAALYDRVLLLGRVGRRDEALRLAKRYRERDPESAWTVALGRELGDAE